MSWIVGAAGWVVENWDVIVGVGASVLGAATLITRLTPSPKDDAFVAKLVSWFSVLQHADVGGWKAPLSAPRAPAPRSDEPLLGVPGQASRADGAAEPEPRERPRRL